MMSVSWRFNTVMALIILAMILQIIAVRYLHTAYKNGLHAGNKFRCTAYLLRSSVHVAAPNTPFRHFRKRAREAHTLQWVTGPGKKRFTTSSASDACSSDELLNTIDE
ncbi:Metallophosphoesterase [Operophtera brumata]|uniref:Metallophosphoesterase n=1 Tax=Operophtera brumata TaxID=104452 RepID=A0A0L7L2N8_OPEBR|nr:Metallophosphoesterase [Operophtera brumata]